MPVEAWIVAFNIEEEGTGGTSVHAKKGTSFRKGEIPAGGSLEMVKGAYLSVNGCKLCQIEAEGAEEAIAIAREAYGNAGGVGGACKKSSWEFKSA